VGTGSLCQIYIHEPPSSVWQVAADNYAGVVFPRRSYFRGEKELFEGLKIMQFEKEWQAYPVIHLDLSTAKGQDSAKELRAKLLFLLKEYTTLYGNDDDETTPGGMLQGLIRRAYEQTGLQVVIIIDEYDAPLLEVLHEEQNLPPFRKVMQEFYQP